MRLFSILMFLLALNVAAYILHHSGAFVVSQELYASPERAESVFNLVTLQNAVVGVVGGVGVAVLVSLITRQYVYATGALILWVIGVLFEPIMWFFVGVPVMLNALGAPVLIVGAVEAFFAFTFFMSILELASQRTITQ